MTSPLLSPPRMVVSLTTGAGTTTTAARTPRSRDDVVGARPSARPAAEASARVYGAAGGEETVAIGADHRVVMGVFGGASPRPPSAASSVATTVGSVRHGDAGLRPASPARRVGEAPAVREGASSPAAATPARGIAWRCGLCGYYTLAMDGHGASLPLSTSAFGGPLPMRCPRCHLEHTSWSAGSPFDVYGRHANLRAGVTGVSRRTGDPNTHEDVPAELVTGPMRGTNAGDSGPSPSTVSASGAQTRASREKRLSYYCGRCGRRLLRVDADGELVAMSTDANGAVLPITCPGCRETHSEWTLRPFFAKAA